MPPDTLFGRLGPGDPIVASAADDAYAMPLAVSIRSVLDTLAPSRRLGVVVLDGGIRPHNRARLERSWASERVELAWITPESGQFDDVPTWRWLSRVAYYRLLLPRLLPDAVQRVIYLDVDLVARADVGGLWTLPFAGRPLLAAQDATSPFLDAHRAMPPGWREPGQGFTPHPVPDYRERGLPPEAPYFNSGVLVLDLAAWRREDLTGRLLACLRGTPEENLLGGDQYPLNVVLAGRWGALDPRWNALAVLHRRRSWRETHFDEATFRAVLDDPWIVHWSGPQKPWNGLGAVPRQELFHRVRRRTAWAGWTGRRQILGARLALARKRGRRRWRHLRRRARRARRSLERPLRAARGRLARWLPRPRPGGAATAFLVGCGRSGTNMVVRRLARSPDVELVNEYDERAFRDWWLRDLDTVAQVARGSPARLVLFKPILDTPRAAQLLERFPDTRVLFALRRVEPVVRSSLALFGEENWPSRVASWVHDDFAEFKGGTVPEASRERIRALWHPEVEPATATALYWLFYTGLFEDLGLAGDPRVRLVRYESVLDAPERELRALCRFLGIRWRAGVAEGVKARPPAGDAPPIEPAVLDACHALYRRLAALAPPAAA